MRDKVGHAQRPALSEPPVDLPRMVAICALVALLLAVSVQVAAAGAFRKSAPQIALRFSPHDAIARAQLAEIYMQADSPEYQQAARELARSAIARTPLAPNALWVMGQSDTVNAARTMAAAQRLSKREPQVLLWLAQRELAANRIEQAVGLFDIALRSSISGRELLFPALASASADPRVAPALAARLRQRPVWRDTFTGFLIDENPDKILSAHILTAYLDPRDKTDAANARSLVLRLAQAGEYQLAWDVKQTFGFGATPSWGGVVDGGFESISDVLPFAWTLADAHDRWAEIVPAPKRNGRVLAINAQTGADGVVASQVVRLAPGTYRVSARVGGFGSLAASAPELAINCIAQKSPVAVARLGSRQANPGIQTLSGHFGVTAECPFQTLSILAPDTTGVQPWIDDVTITRN